MRHSKRLCAAVLVLVSLLIGAAVFPNNVHAAAVSAGEAVLDCESGRVLYEHNADKQMPMASTTKILTAIIILEDCDLDAVVTVPPQAAGTEGSSIYLIAGEKITVRDLLYGLMLRSGNDCAVTLALYHSGTVEAFAACMNARAQTMGAVNSSFVNPHGLPAEGHYTTALDLARIAAYALRNASFREIVSAKEWRTDGDGTETVRLFHNKNKMLYNYAGADGVKTGYTKEAGRCLVASAERSGSRYVCVTLNSPSMYERSAELLDGSFAKFRRACLFDAETFSVRIPAGSRGKSCACACRESFYYPLAEGEERAIRIEKDVCGRLCLPVRRGDAAGELRIFLENQLLFSQKIVSIEEVKKSFSDILYEIAKNGRGKSCASTNISQPAASPAAAPATNL